jgi:hypothetical protein
MINNRGVFVAYTIHYHHNMAGTALDGALKFQVGNLSGGNKKSLPNEGSQPHFVNLFS